MKITLIDKRMIRSTDDNDRILIVDDSAATLEVLHRNLVSAGYMVFAALNVTEAIKILDVTPIDLVITDLKMPGLSGVHLLRHIRENFSDMEVIILQDIRA